MDNKRIFMTLLTLLFLGLVITGVTIIIKRSHKDHGKKPKPTPSTMKWSDQEKKDFLNNVIENFIKLPCISDPNFAKMYNDTIVMITENDLIPYLQSKMSYDMLVKNILLNKGDQYWLPNLLTACYKEYCTNVDCISSYPKALKQYMKLSFACLNKNCDNFDKNFDAYVSKNKIYPWMIFDSSQPDSLFANMMKSVCL